MPVEVILKEPNLLEKIKEECGNSIKRVSISTKDGYGKEHKVWAYLLVNKKGDVQCKMFGLNWFTFKLNDKTESVTFYYNSKQK